MHKITNISVLVAEDQTEDGQAEEGVVGVNGRPLFASDNLTGQRNKAAFATLVRMVLNNNRDRKFKLMTFVKIAEEEI